MAETADIVIVGAGIIGLSCAFQLARRTQAKIIVLEKGASLGEGSTGASSAICRAKYTRDEMVILARDGISAYRNWGDFLGISSPIARYHELGVVWIGDGNTLSPDRDAERLISLGVAAEVLNNAMLYERYPALNPCPIAPDLLYGEPHDCTQGGPHLLEPEGGYVEPVDALEDLLSAVRQRGVDVRLRSKVANVIVENGKVSGIALSSGDVISCGSLVTSAGPWCNELFEHSGIFSPWPLAPTRIQIVQVDRPPTLVGTIPVCADPSGGIYFRSHNRSQQIVIGSLLEEDEGEVVDPDAFDLGTDDAFVHTKIHALQHRLRGLDVIRNVRGYSGLYTMNQADVHPVVGATPIAGLYVANGFSGHGFKIAPAIGSLVAQAITGEKIVGDAEVGSEFLAFDRKPIAVSSRSVLA